MSKLIATPGQTVGPFYGYALPYEGGPELVPAGSPGSVFLHGKVLDGAGKPVPDSLLEIWQADASGGIPHASGSLRRDGYTFTGFGRASTDDEGNYGFWTVNPGAVTDERTGTSGLPFIAVTVFARGLMNRLFTRVYLPEAAPLENPDALLASVPADRRGTLVASRGADGSLIHDLRLQGDDETVFLDFS